MNLIVLISLNLMLSVLAHSRIMHRHSEMINHKKLLHKIDHSEPDLIHNFTVVIQQNNLDLLDEMLIARSTPGHELYQSWMTKDEIDAYSRNDVAVEAVTTWLLEHNVNIDAFSANQEFIYASAPIRQLEKMLDTKFYKWNATYLSDNVHRSEAYSLPIDIKPHVAGKLIPSHNALLPCPLIIFDCVYYSRRNVQYLR